MPYLELPSDMAEKLDNPLVRDKKVVPLAGFSALPAAAFLTAVGVPTWLFVLLPTAVVSQAVKYLIPSLFVKKETPKEDPVPEAPALTAADTSSRQLDLVLFGATGFTGQLACSYLAKTYGRTVKWAIAGRRRDALEKIRASLGPQFSDLPIIIADSSDFASVRAMARNTRVVITTAGPFELYGTRVVSACAEHGTHYCDITGEVDWVRLMVEKYDGLARKSGARIVHFCGHDCVPWDITVLALAKELASRGDSLVEANCYTDTRGSFSGGTLATMLRALDRPAGSAAAAKTTAKAAGGGRPADPLTLLPGGTVSERKATPKLSGAVHYARDVGKWAGPFVMAAVNAGCVRRSQALGAYPGAAAAVTYRDEAAHPGFFAAAVSVGSLALFFTSLAAYPIRWILFRLGLLPGTGEGPSVAAMDQGYLLVTGIGRGAKGGKVRSILYYPTDAGYRDTARMLCESGLLLALEPHRATASASGVLTPASGLGTGLLDRLVATGCSFSVTSA